MTQPLSPAFMAAFPDVTFAHRELAVDQQSKGTTMLHPIGTNIRDIHHFDRGIKVVFACKEHPQYEYMSKEPGRSQWFPANEAARKLQWGEVDECPHKFRDDVWVTTQEYEDATPVFVVEEVTYKGQELIVMREADTFSVDVRADATDGALVAGFTGFTRQNEALLAGMRHVDKEQES